MSDGGGHVGGLRRRKRVRGSLTAAAAACTGAGGRFGSGDWRGSVFAGTSSVMLSYVCCLIVVLWMGFNFFLAARIAGRPTM